VKILSRNVLVRVDGSKGIGLGHVYNMLTVLDHLKDDKILIVMKSNKRLGSNKFKKCRYRVKYFSSKKELIRIIRRFKPQIIFNDILNTDPSYMQSLRPLCCLIVNFEDLGLGRKFANLVFNPIYFSKKHSKNEFYGNEYACIRKEFRVSKKNYLRKNVKQCVITFGGTDPTDKTFRTLKIIHNSGLSMIKWNVILGLGYQHRKKIKDLADRMRKDGYAINIIEKSDNLSSFIRDSDFAISSNGRSVFEIVAMKVPIIAIAVNARERQHSFVLYSKCGIHIDAFSNLENGLLLDCIKKMLKNKTRQKFIENMMRYNLLDGLDRITKIINDEFKNSNDFSSNPKFLRRLTE